MAAEHTQHMQKSLTLMNLQIHHVLSDITGASGLAILDTILAGNRDPMCLAHLCNIRVKSPRETVAQALVGDYRPEHLFTLKLSLDGYRYCQKLIAELDDEIARLMHTLPNAVEHPSPMPKRTKRTAYQRMGNDPSFDLRSELYRIAGVDLNGMVRRFSQPEVGIIRVVRRRSAMELFTLGIDLGKTTFHSVGMNQRGEVVVRKRFTRTQLLHFTANLKVELIGMEACGGSHFLGRALLREIPLS
jgi:hypothetical protein